MAMKPYKKAVAVTGTYQSGGQEKKRYVQVGTLFQYDDGGLALKIESLPVGGEWNGFVSFFDLEQKGDQPRQQGQSRGGGGHTGSFDQDDMGEIPFITMFSLT